MNDNESHHSVAREAVPFGEAKHLDFTLVHYQRASGHDIRSVRSGQGDAAHMCDAIAADILRENTKRGRVSKVAQQQAAALKRAGDAIWAMREMLR